MLDFRFSVCLTCTPNGKQNVCHKLNLLLFMKTKTNTQAFKALFKDFRDLPQGLILEAMLRERILAIMDLTLESIEESPESWENSFIHADLYKELDKVVKKNIGFNN